MPWLGGDKLLSCVCGDAVTNVTLAVWLQVLCSWGVLLLSWSVLSQC